ncbi:MAG TPA: ATP-binding protein [Gemmatimonadaceae bacterium]|nr:ATP-binding protein [Gemmatimonadaceae bacterium]
MTDAAVAVVPELTDDELRSKLDAARRQAGVTNPAVVTHLAPSGGPGTMPPRSERLRPPPEMRTAQCVGCGTSIEQQLGMTSERLEEARSRGYAGPFLPETFYEPKRCVACAATQQEGARMNRIGNLLRGLTAAGVPLRVLFDATQFIPTQDGAKLRKALRQLRMKEAATPWVYAHGARGTGKSTEANRAVAVLLWHNPHVVVRAVSFPDLLLKIRATYAKDSTVSELQILDQYRRADLLILDDVGSEKPTAASAGVLYSVINFRYDGMLPTVITSNYSLGRLADHLAPADSPDEVMQAQRICDRILEMASAVEIRDQSHRGEVAKESNIGRVRFMKLISDLAASRPPPRFEQPQTLAVAGHEREPVTRRAIEEQIAAMMPDFSDETAGKAWRKPADRRGLP